MGSERMSDIIKTKLKRVRDMYEKSEWVFRWGQDVGDGTGSERRWFESGRFPYRWD